MKYVLLILILLLYLYFGLSHKRENFIIYYKENADSKPVGVDFSNYNIYYEKIVNGPKLTGSYTVNNENITFDNNGAPSKLMNLEQLKKTAETLGDECVGFIVLGDDSGGSQKRNSVFLKSVTELLSDPLSLETNLEPDQKSSYKNELSNYPKNTSFIKKFSKRVREQNIPDLKDGRTLFSKTECAIIDDGKNDILNFKGTLAECKTKCASYAECQGFNRGIDVADNNTNECILKKTYQNKEGVCNTSNKYISYSRGGQIQYEIWEIKERERIERERIEKERREKEERERKERERIEKERREREERERKEREERERKEREEREKREKEERDKMAKERQFYKNWVNMYKSSSTLLFRASSHGWDPNTFHSYCDNRGPTITVAYLSDGRIVGGYNYNSWQLSNWSYVSSTNTLLFDDYDKYNNKPGYQVYSSVNYTPYLSTFGGGHDFHINHSNRKLQVYHWGFSNNNNVGPLGQSYGQISYNDIRDVEVYSVNASWFN